MKFKLFGTEIYISFLFAALITFMIATDRTGLIIPTFFAVVLHEIGHLFAMWVTECSPRSINLIPASVEIVRSFSKKKYGETVIAICGPAANFIVFLGTYINYLKTNNETVITFGLLNLIIGLFNLLPVWRLDGGTVLFNIINRFFGALKAERAVKITTLVTAVSIIILGIFATIKGFFNPSIFIIAVYLLISVIIKF